ncbi:WAS/WASL-interacting protein family member 3 [Drosophila santomea]|uniref:WAS/WASL-interacting protein family member 3 n=1 Tax=Drosophila santomea TaxID=129105 RepID=UPI001952ABD3|nr:WAS/WASL-interacting protein family member 3 [Drosophila santomea]
MELDMRGPEQLLPSLPASSTRQLVRRRSGRAAESPRGQRCRSTNTTNTTNTGKANANTPTASTGKWRRLSPASSGNIAVVRPGGSNDTRGQQDRRHPRASPVKPPRQALSARLVPHSNPYLDDQSPKERRPSVSQRSQRSAVRNRNQHHPTLAATRTAFGGHYTVPPAPPAPPAPPTLRRAAPQPPGSQMRPCLRAVRAKVDSHLCPHLATHPRSAPKQQQRDQPSCQRPCQPTKGKSLAEAHQQLELMLSRIERVTDYQPPPPPPPVAQFRRRGAGAKVAKGVSRQMAQPPPVPAGTPMLSARRNNHNGGGGAELAEDRDRNGDGNGDGEGDHHNIAIPLVQNPQQLPPAKRDALLQLLQRSEQHDKGIVDMVGATGDASRDTMLMLLQMIPLSLTDSPYKEKLLKGHRQLKERQEMKVLEKELKDENKVHTYMKTEPKVHATGRYNSVSNAPEYRSVQHPLTERQEQAMRERAQLERDKQLVISCREKRLLKEQIRKLNDSNQIKKNPTTPRPTDPWQQVLHERDRFQANCNRSCFYNNSHSSAPWKIYAKVASKLSSQLIESVDVEFHRSVANYINDIVGHKVN